MLDWAPSDPPLRVGLALGAGSAAAMAEIGVIEVLAEAGIPIHCVAGTSAGSIVGAAMAAGQLNGLRETLAELSPSRLIRLFDLTWPREGFLYGKRALELIRPYLGDQIEDLALPFAAVATDLHSGEEVLLRSGSVFDAVRASIAVPGIFTPWRVGGRVLVDGGLVNPVPVSVAETLGAEFVIAISVLPLVLEPRTTVAHTSTDGNGGEVADEAMGLIDAVSQASTIVQAQIATHRLHANPPGFLLRIPSAGVGMFEVHRTGELAEAGRKAAREALPALQQALDRAVPLGRNLARRLRAAAARISRTEPG